ncbi:Uncharacterised protein [Alcaligenes faecalis subsp. faecalis]|nr:Uncharacterised protein [Alcaligenes faecalis subsp. faecalis]
MPCARKCHLVQLSSDTARINAKLAISLVNLPIGNPVLNPALGITNSNTFMKTRPALPLASCSIKVGFTSSFMLSGKMDS